MIGESLFQKSIEDIDFCFPAPRAKRKFIDPQERVAVAFQFQLPLNVIFQIFLIKVVLGHHVRVLGVEFEAIIFDDQRFFLAAPLVLVNRKSTR